MGWERNRMPMRDMLGVWEGAGGGQDVEVLPGNR
jgi:hypothetical protein